MNNVAWVTLQNIGFQFLVKPSVHGLVSDYTLAVPWPKNNDWSSVKF